MVAATRRARAQSLVRPLLARLLFAILVLLPVASLFGLHWRSTGEVQAFSRSEQQGIEYLRTLGPLTAALAEAQSAAVTGGEINRAELTGAIAAVGAVDARLGGALGTSERWADLRGRVEQLSVAKPSAGQPAFDAYRETTDLLLALFARVQEGSNLNRDPDADVYYLADGLSRQLPAFVVATGRFNDLVTIYAGLAPVAPPSAKDDAATTAARAAQNRALAVAFGRLFSAQAAVSAPADNLTRDLQEAVAVSESPTMGSALFSSLDGLRISIDALSAPSLLGDGEVNAADVAALGAMWHAVLEAVNPPVGQVLDEMNALVGDRLDGVAQQRLIALVAAGLAVVIALGPVLALTVSRRRRGADSAPSGRHGVADEDTGSSSYPVWSPPDPVAATASAGPLPQRERSGAAR